MIYIGFEEVWKRIKINGIKTHYEISTFGNIRNTKSGKYLKPVKKGKYYLVNISYKDKNGKSKVIGKQIHRLVAETFIPIPKRYIENGYNKSNLEVDHIRDWDEDNHEDNSIYNLQWLTKQENIDKAEDYGKYKKDYMKGKKFPEWNWMVGELNPNAIYTDEFVEEICKEIVKDEKNSKEIAKMFGVKKSFVDDILYKDAWKHISEKYNIGAHGVIEGSVNSYKRSDLVLLDTLIKKGIDNSTIRTVLNWECNKTTSALISKHRKKLGENTQERKSYSDEYLKKLDDLILSGKSTKEICRELNEEIGQRMYVLISSHKRKLKKKNYERSTTIESIS